MNTTLIPSPTRTTLMPADVPTTTSPDSSAPSAATTREGVNTVALIEIRRQRTAGGSRRRAWDELPEADRQVRMREARRRMQRERELRAARDAHEMTLYGMRGQR